MKQSENIQEKSVLDFEKIIKNIMKNPSSLSTVYQSYSTDKEIILALVQLKGWILRYAAEYLKADKEVVLEAVKTNSSALAYASDSLKEDREIVLLAVQKFGQALTFASDDLRADKEIAYAAIQNDASSFSYIAKEFQTMEAFVLYYVRYLKRKYKDIDLEIYDLNRARHQKLEIAEDILKKYWEII